MQDFNDVAIFTRVAARKSFSAAARELRLSPSVVSKRVSALEESLGAQLLNRSTRRLSLTEAGSQFFERSTRAIDEIEMAGKEVAGYSDKLTGTLRIHATLGVGLRAVAAGILEFRAHYPELAVDFTIGTEAVNLLEQGADVVIRSAELRDASLDSRVLVPVVYHVCAAPDYFRRAGVPKVPADLARHNCLIHTGRRAPYDWVFNGPDGHYVVRVSGDFSTNSGAALHEACLRGFGIAHLPGYTAWQPLQSGQLVSIFDGLHSSDRCIRAVFPRSRHPQARLTLFLDFIEGYLKDRHARAWSRINSASAPAVHGGLAVRSE